jgi:glycine C-acetyltransferase
MENTNIYQGGENFSLSDILIQTRRKTLKERTEFFSDYINEEIENNRLLYMRVVDSQADREVKILDPKTGKTRKMLMFGSNNYLGLANNPYIKESVKKSIEKYGIGIGGPPLLNGYTKLHYEVEEMLADFKNKESAMIFASGYGANVGLVSGLINRDDIILYDEYSHASLCDGIKMGRLDSYKFRHNDVSHLEELLRKYREVVRGEIFVCVEGVYSMDGDLAPLDEMAPLCKKYKACLIVDDAHGTGVTGETGGGTAQHFGVEDDVDIIMGTFSKALGVTGGFVAGDKCVTDYLRFFARSYMFSASLPPIIAAAVKAGLETIKIHPEYVSQLRSNINYAVAKLNENGFGIKTQTPIIALRVPTDMDIRKAVFKFHEMGIFLNSIEYPAVPISQQRFRISLMSIHTKEDIDKLVSAVCEVWYGKTRYLHNAS